MIILLTDKNILLFHQNQSIEEAKFTCFLLGKAVEKLAKNYVNASKLIKVSNKIDQLNQIEIIFLENQMNGLIFERLK